MVRRGGMRGDGRGGAEKGSKEEVYTYMAKEGR